MRGPIEASALVVVSLVSVDRAHTVGPSISSSRSPARFALLVAKEARGAVLAVYLLRSLAGAFAVPSQLSVWTLTQMVLAIASMIFAVMCVYLYNGLSDIEQDRINGSNRPLATGAITSSQVKHAISALIAVDAVMAVFLPFGATLCNTAMILLGFVYSGGRFPAKMHGTVALIVAGIGATLPYLSAGLVAAGRLEPQLVVTAVLLGAWVWAGGAAKDLSDVPGDAMAGRATLPVRAGERGARQVIAVRLGLVALVSTVLGALGLAAPAMLAAPGCAAVLVMVALRAPVRDDRRTKRRLYRAFMSSQYTLNGALLLVPVVT